MTAPLRSLPGGSEPGLALPRPGTIALVVGGFLAVNLIIAAVYIGGRGDENRELPVKIESVIPAPDAVIRPQEDVGADLADDHIGVLEIDGVPIPEDQLTIREALGEVLFRPAEGREIERLRPGPHSATIFYWQQGKAVDKEDAFAKDVLRSFTWSFTAG